MAIREYKCYGTCGEKYEKQLLTNHNGKNYCSKCLEEMFVNKENMQTLYNLIKRHYNVTFPTSMHLSQIKNCKNQGYNYEDMIIAFNYCIDVLHTKLNPKMGFGWISSKIEEAKEHNREENERKSQVSDVYDDQLFKVESVKVAKIDITNTYKEEKKIKWEDILGGNK